MFNIEKCEKCIGEVFNDKNLLMQCFTHSSYSNEHRNSKNYERLEFLGDSVLGFVVSDYLFKKYRDNDEGKMTDLKQGFVSNAPLVEAAKVNGFTEFLIVGNSFKNNEISDKICEDVFEAVVGGIYLDKGFDRARNFIYKNLLEVVSEDYFQNPKGELKEFLKADPKYDLISSSGPDNDKSFVFSCKIDGKVIAEGSGKSHKKAQCEAAKKALAILKNKR